MQGKYLAQCPALNKKFNQHSLVFPCVMLRIFPVEFDCSSHCQVRYGFCSFVRGKKQTEKQLQYWKNKLCEYVNIFKLKTNFPFG